jgi:signal transduction histidine kinase/CheY-like chemotaxis protein
MKLAMPKSANSAPDPAEQRCRAEARLRDQQERGAKPGPPKSEADTRRLLHELEVHQIELEMQNEELSDARDKMEALLEKYTDLYDFAPVAYLTLGLAGDILEANLAAASQLGLARSALMTQPFRFFVAPTSRLVFDAFLKKVFEGGIREECDLILLLGGKKPFDARIKANLFESGEACRMAVSDITEEKRAEADRLILNKLESTGILAGGIAHDFNNLLTVILLNVELAEMLNPANAEQARHLEEAKKSALKTRGLTAQLLTFAEGGAPIRRPAPLSGLIQESVRLALSGSKVQCEFSLAADLWPAEVDEAQMGQVLRGIALNAREAMPKGGVLSVRAENVVLKASEHPSLAAGNYVRVSLADQGIGIPKEVLPKIFDPYFSTKQRGDRKGMGLGLTICYSIVQKHAGVITVESAVGVGTTLQVYLPATQALRSLEKAPANVPQPGRVLVMDDEVAVREVVGRTLSGMGHEVVLVQNGQRALEAYRTAKLLGRSFDVVILGLINRDGMGGRETLQELLKYDLRVKAIAMSGHTLDPVMLEPERHGFKGVLTKPFEIEQLQEVLSRVMGGSTASKPAP